MINSLTEELKRLTEAAKVEKTEVIQSLWGGYGELARYKTVGANTDSIIVKEIKFPSHKNHPRGWNTERSHQRKVKSYEVELAWYASKASLCNEKCKVPKCYQTLSHGDNHLIFLEDLDASGFPKRRSSLNITEAKLGLEWLANFHALFLNESPDGLWEEGSYWHLATRPDELEAMQNGELKQKAITIDGLLSNCKFKTIIHGDAKVANFCFSNDMKRVAAVDFQYVGGGCGMKDLVYFLGSCLTEQECEQYEAELLDDYFTALSQALIKIGKDFSASELEAEWRGMYSVAWADFTRFLMGWMPTHSKLNSYSEKMVQQTLNLL